MNRRHVVGPVLAVVMLTAVVLSGCVSPGRSACNAPDARPTTLSPADRRDPVVASDGGGGLVAIWESLTGGPIEASVRDAAGVWSPAVALSGRSARDPSVAVSPDGAVVAAWQVSASAETTTVQVATYAPGGGWSTPTDVSQPGRQTREPQVGLTADGTQILTWTRDTAADSAVVEVVERPAGTTAWTAARLLSDADGRAKRPRLAIAPNGAAAVVWEQTISGRRTARTATRSPDGLWSQQVQLTTDTADVSEPDVAIGPTGDVAAVWIDAAGDGAAVVAVTRPEGGAWSAPTTIGRGSDVPHETARPGRAETGADIAVLPDGRIVAVWTIVVDDANRAQSAATDPNRTWSPAGGLSRPHASASGAQVVALAGGVAAAGWEELDGGLIRARVARLDSQGSPTACADLTAATAESGAIRLVGGSAPGAAFVDFNRNRVQVAPIR